MKAELFIRLYHLQEEKLDACLDYLEKVSKMMVDNVEITPDTMRDEFINITKPFVEKYNILLGQEGSYEEENKQD